MFHTYFDNPHLINTELEEYRRISAEQMQETARTYLNNSNRTVLTFVPETEERS
jgi:hypothetical protein